MNGVVNTSCGILPLSYLRMHCDTYRRRRARDFFKQKTAYEIS